MKLFMLSIWGRELLASWGGDEFFSARDVNVYYCQPPFCAIDYVTSTTDESR